MSYFVKRPEVFEGRQWDGTYEDALDIVHWSNFGVHLTGSDTNIKLVNLLGGFCTIKPLDWLVKDALGGLYGVYDSNTFQRLFVQHEDDDICECGNTFCMENHNQQEAGKDPDTELPTYEDVQGVIFHSFNTPSGNASMTLVHASRAVDNIAQRWPSVFQSKGWR